MSIIIYTDGSSRGNPGAGGYGAILLCDIFDKNKIIDQKVVEIGGREDKTTNNRMELSACIKSLQCIVDRKIEGDIEVFSDSSYVLNGITGWVFGWQKNGWKTSAGEDVLNKDLWEELANVSFFLKQKRKLTWTKVKGHSGVFLNERADSLATLFADQNVQLLFTGKYSDYKKLYEADFTLDVASSQTKKIDSKSSSKKPYAYVSLVDNIFHEDHEWSVCEKRVKGKKAVKFKKVFSKQELEDLKKEWVK